MLPIKKRVFPQHQSCHSLSLISHASRATLDLTCQTRGQTGLFVLLKVQLLLFYQSLARFVSTLACCIKVAVKPVRPPLLICTVGLPSPKSRSDEGTMSSPKLLRIDMFFPL